MGEVPARGGGARLAGEAPGDRERSRARGLVSARELAAVLAWALVMAALTAAPYLWAINRAPAGAQFQGFIWGVDDGNVYLSWIRQAAEGRVLLRNQYTTRPQDPHFFNIFLQALGRVTAWTGQHPAVIFHAARLLGVAALLVCIYLLAAMLSARRAVRWAALLLASLGSGLGWLAALMARSLPDYLPASFRPPDYAPPPPHTWQTMPEAVTFLSMLLNPLFVWSMAIMALVLIAALMAVERRSAGWAAAAGGLLLLVGNMHTYDVFVLHGTMVVYALVMIGMGRLRWRDAALGYAIILGISAAAPVWAWWAARQDPAYQAKVETPTLSPPPLDFAMGYGLILLLALGGAAYALRHRAEQPRLLLPVCWAGVNALLVYAPVPFQRKLAEGLHIPLCVLAAVALVLVIAPRLARKSAPPEPEPEPGALPAGVRLRATVRPGQPSRTTLALIVVLTVALTMPSNALFVADCLSNVADNNRALLYVLQPPIYLSFDEVRGLEYLARHAEDDDIVLCSSLMGNYVPVRARCLVFAGHWAETLHFPDAVSFIGQYLLPGRSAKVLEAATRQVRATYVVYGPQEALVATQMLVAAGQPAPEDPAGQFREITASFLEAVFACGEMRVYQVRPEGASTPPLDHDLAAPSLPPGGDGP